MQCNSAITVLLVLVLYVPDIMTTETQSRPLFIRLTLPDGLEEALEGLAREVLRSQPENILEFAANHFEHLVKTRGSAGGEPKSFSTLHSTGLSLVPTMSCYYTASISTMSVFPPFLGLST